jgi:hypothetical protein
MALLFFLYLRQNSFSLPLRFSAMFLFFFVATKAMTAASYPF